ncbi:MAG: hypothetical protein VB861_14910, partial [Planctomycetaceae bacterium]
MSKTSSVAFPFSVMAGRVQITRTIPDPHHSRNSGDDSTGFLDETSPAIVHFSSKPTSGQRNRAILDTAATSSGNQPAAGSVK